MDYRDLIHRAQGGDEDAFTALYQGTYAPLYRFVLIRVKDRALADDITQETFIKFLGALPTYTAQLSPLPYLHTVAKNSIIDHFRKRAPDYDDEALWALGSGAPTQEEVAILGEDVGEALRLLAELSVDEAEAIKCKYLDGLETKEISAHLDKSEESVRQILSRGMRRLRSLYDGTHG